MMKYASIACLLLLAACGSTRSNIAALEVALTAADTAALAYVDLPLCNSVPAGRPCADLGIVASIGVAEVTAHSAIKAAEVAQDQSSFDKAQSAIAALQQLIAAIGGK